MSHDATALRTVPFRILIDDAVKYSRRHFATIYWPIAIPVCLAQLLVLGAQALFLGDFFLDSAPTEIDFAGFGGFFLTVLVLGFVIAVAYSVLAYCVVDALAGRPLDIGGRWRFAVRPRTLGTVILMGLAVGGATLLCFFPGIYVYLLLGFTLPVLAEESRFGSDALGRSAELARFNPRRKFVDNPMTKLFLIAVIAAGLTYVVSLAVQLPFIVAQQFILFREAAESGSAAIPGWAAALQVPAQLLGSLVSTAIQLYSAFCIALLYFDVRRRREGSDLESAIDAMAGGRSPAPPPSEPA